MHTSRVAGQLSLGAGARLPWVLAKACPPPPVALQKESLYLQLPIPSHCLGHIPFCYLLLGGSLTDLGHLCPSQDEEGSVKKKNSGLVIFYTDLA